MSDKPKYWDKRTDFFKSYFDKALSYDDYLANGSEQDRAKWNQVYEHASLSDEQISIVKGFKRKLNVLVMSGIWCGDCVRQGPLLKKIEEASNLICFRFIDNRENPELLEELKINGAQKVPVIVALSEDFFEVERFGDRHLSVYRRKVEQELGVACDPGILPPARDDLSVETGEWISFFERIQHMLRLAPALRAKYSD